MANKNGTTGNDTINGSNAADTLKGLQGNDLLLGGGNDVLYGDDVASTYAGDDHLDGGSGDDKLYGGYGNDTLVGCAGKDSLYGGQGDDTYFVDNTADLVFESASANQGTDTVISSVSYSLAGSLDRQFIENLTLTGTAAVGTGNELANVLKGNDVANLLDGGLGNDTIYGGAGNDTLLGNGGDDIVQGEAGDDTVDGGVGTDTAVYGGSRADYTITQVGGSYRVVHNNGGSDGSDMLSSVERLAFADQAMNLGSNNVTDGELSIAGLAAQNQVLTVAGTLSDADGMGPLSYQWESSTDGESWIAVAGATDSSLTTTAADVGRYFRVVASYTDGFGTPESVTSSATEIVAHQRGGDGDDTLIGTPGVDILAGGGGNDSIDGGASADLMLGGTGNDTFYADNASDQVVEFADEGTDTVITSDLQSYTLGEHLENLTMSGGQLTATGNDLDNVLTTQQGFTRSGDVLDGGLGADTLNGGGGSDTYYVDNIGDVVVETWDDQWGGIDTVVASVDHTLEANVENLTLTAGGLVGTGNGLDNVFTVVDSSNRIVEAANGGNDTVRTGADYTLDANVENAVLTASGVTVTGNELNNTFTLFDGSDTLIETATGGIDTVVTSYVQNYTLGEHLENLTMFGGQLSAHGNELDNVIMTEQGFTTSADVLDGGVGADTLNGGGGSDTYYVDNAGDVVVETWVDQWWGGIDTVVSSVDHTLEANVENLTLTAGGLVGTGNGLDNTFTVVDGSNRIVEAAGGGIDTVCTGADYTLDANVENAVFTAGGITVTGNELNNSFALLDGSDTVVEAANGGIDTVVTSYVQNYTLGENLENLTMFGGQLSAHGNELDNVIMTEQGFTTSADVLDGGLGADTLNGGGGSDTYFVDNVGDVVVETWTDQWWGGIDTVLASADHSLEANVENLTLTGSADLNATGNTLDNVLVGNAGDNVLTGAVGNDTLDGGAGSDTAVYGGNRFDYTITQEGSSYRIVHNAGGSDGSDILTSVERLVFADRAMNLGSNNLPEGELTIAGLAAQNKLLTVAGTLADADGMGPLSYQWESSTDGSNWTAVTGATGASLTTTAADVGCYFRVVASYTDGFGTAESVTSSATEIIAHQRGGAGNDTLIGTSAVDILAGGSGNDTIDGRESADLMLGGSGNDTFYVGSVGDQVIEYAEEGTDTVYTSGVQSYTLADNVENLTMSGWQVTATGNALDNVLMTPQGFSKSADVIDGGAGADIMNGGYGSDIYYVDNAGDVVVETSTDQSDRDRVVSSVDYTLGANIEYLTLTAGGLVGTGNGLDNWFAVVDGSNRIVEAVNGGMDTVVTGTDYTLDANVENATLLADGITVTGNELNNIYSLNYCSNDTLVEAAGGGTDTVVTNGRQTYTLGENLENLKMNGVGLAAYGNELANLVMTEQGLTTSADLLDGGLGADTLNGGGGDDTYIVDNVGDVVVETWAEQVWSGIDTVVASASHSLEANVENLTLTGSANLSATGNTLNNVLVGNAGSNVLTGGAGADVFRFDQVLDAATNLDTITDFTVGSDRIELENAIFTALQPGGALAADWFVGGADAAAAVDANDFVIYNSTSGALYYDFNGNAAGGQVQFATLSSGLNLSASDFFIS